MVKGQNGAGHLGIAAHEILEFLLANPMGQQERIAEHLIESGQEMLLFLTRKRLDVETEYLAQADENARGHRTLVPLDKIEISRGNPEFLGHARCVRPRSRRSRRIR